LPGTHLLFAFANEFGFHYQTPTALPAMNTTRIAIEGQNRAATTASANASTIAKPAAIRAKIIQTHSQTFLMLLSFSLLHLLLVLPVSKPLADHSIRSHRLCFCEQHTLRRAIRTSEVASEVFSFSDRYACPNLLYRHTTLAHTKRKLNFGNVENGSQLLQLRLRLILR